MISINGAIIFYTIRSNGILAIPNAARKSCCFGQKHIRNNPSPKWYAITAVCLGNA